MSARMRRIELAETRMRRARSLPWMRIQPQRRFSRPSLTITSTSSSTSGVVQDLAVYAIVSTCVSRVPGASEAGSVA